MVAYGEVVVASFPDPAVAKMQTQRVVAYGEVVVASLPDLQNAAENVAMELDGAQAP